MKTLSQFQCEICNTVYKSETECKACENSHCLPVAIKVYKFNSYKNDGEYPQYIDVAMENGKIIRYKR
nr:MAG TPA: Rubredoxin [Caudoviricetes sp.]